MSDVKAEEATLRNTITNIDALSQEGFSMISAIASLALIALDGPDAAKHMRIVAESLRAIRGKAEDIENCINCAAEDVGCNYLAKEKSRAIAESLERAVVASGVSHD